MVGSRQPAIKARRKAVAPAVNLVAQLHLAAVGVHAAAHAFAHQRTGLAGHQFLQLLDGYGRGQRAVKARGATDQQGVEERRLGHG